MPSFERLVEEYGERAFQYAYRLTGNVDDAKDLVQEVFCRALRNWRGYDDSQPVENWFFTILRNLYLDGVRRLERRPTVSLDAPAEDGEPGSDGYDEIAENRADRVLEALEREESAVTVRAALKRLKPEHRAVLTLADVEGFAYEKIARVLRCPVGTVRSRVSRARNALKAVLTEEALAGDRD